MTDDRLYFNIHKMELERVKYMLKSFLRTRIFKIERNLLFLIEKDYASLMSEGEMEYAWSIYESKKTLFNQSLYMKIPSSLNHFDKENLDERMGKLLYLKLYSHKTK